MARLTFLDQGSLWPTLLKLAHTPGRGPCSIASAYLGVGSANRLRLRRGDRLITSLSVRAAKLGQVSPADLAQYRRGGVLIYREDRLHAKIYLFDGVVVIGSANISSSSEDRLEEAAVLTTDASIRRQVTEWFERRCSQEVEDAFLALCAKAWRPPKVPAGLGQGRKARDGSREPDDPERLWILRLQSSFADPAAYRRVRTRLSIQSQRTNRPAAHSRLDSFSWHGAGGIGPALRPGDSFIGLMWDDRGREAVFPLSTVLATMPSRRSTGRRERIWYVRYAEPDVEISLPWSEFRRLAAREGIRLKERIRSGAVEDPEAARELRKLGSVAGMREALS